MAESGNRDLARVVLGEEEEMERDGGEVKRVSWRTCCSII